MRFTSFAQNMEDVVLWRALKHVDKGFYIDVGAQSPHIDSVTKSFYIRGWRGINIEPNPEYCQELHHERPEDINLQLALGEHDGSATLYIIPHTGLTTLDKVTANKHHADGRPLLKAETHITTLRLVCQHYVKPSQPIHFMKIDAEAYEEAIIRGHDWQSYRPWILIIEAMLPSQQIECHAEWEPLLTTADYLFVYADGLNRFYVAKEHEGLAAAFLYPPNVFDGFTTHQLVEAQAHLDHQHREITQLKHDLDVLDSQKNQALTEKSQALAEKQQLHIQRDEIETQYYAIINSFSWRLTAPLRRMNYRTKQALKALVIALIMFVKKHPRLKYKLQSVAKRFPSITARLKILALTHSRRKSSKSISNAPTDQLSGDDFLSDYDKMIYNKLLLSKKFLTQGQNECAS